MKKHWRNILIAGLVLLAALSWAGWKFLKPQTTFSTLLVGGSSTVHPYVKALAEAYTETHPNYRIHCVTGGSTPGLMAVSNGAIDLATMSRDLTEDEDNGTLKNYLIGRDGLGILVHPDNPVQDLSLDQLEAIFTGQITNWTELTGDSPPGTSAQTIQVVSSPVTSTAYAIARDLLLLGDELPSSTLYAADAAALTELVAANPNAIGFATLHDTKGPARLVTVGQVGISRETILTSRYLLTRSFYLVISLNTESLAKTRESGTVLDRLLDSFKMDNEQVAQLRTDAILDFADFVRSQKGQQIIERMGALAVY